jgi:hypothetical protein
LEKVLKIEPGRKALIFFSDGVDNKSSTTREDTMELARQTEAPIYCVYFNTDPYRNVRSPVVPNGRTTLPGENTCRSLQALAGLFWMHLNWTIWDRFFENRRDLASQYSIGYYPKSEA